MALQSTRAEREQLSSGINVLGNAWPACLGVLLLAGEIADTAFSRVGQSLENTRLLVCQMIGACSRYEHGQTENSVMKDLSGGRLV